MAANAAVATARAVRARDWTDVAGRIGLATQGVLYIVVAILALHIAAGDQEQADQEGAIEAVARQPLGRWLLLVLVAGLVLHSLWRFSLAWRGDAEPGDDATDTAKDWLMRLANAGRGLLYAGLAAGAIRVFVWAEGSGGSGDKEKRATAAVLGWPGGRFLVIVGGLAVVGAGLWQFRQPVTQSFLKKLRSDLTAGTRRLATVIGSIGFTARGVVFAMLGVFLVQAALQYDPQEAQGIDGAFDELVASSNGPLLLRILGVGMIAFGVFRLLDARYRSQSKT